MEMHCSFSFTVIFLFFSLLNECSFLCTRRCFANEAKIKIVRTITQKLFFKVIVGGPLWKIWFCFCVCRTTFVTRLCFCSIYFFLFLAIYLLFFLFFFFFTCMHIMITRPFFSLLPFCVFVYTVRAVS